MNRYLLVAFAVATLIAPTLSAAATAGEILTSDTFCITSINPVISQKLKAGERFPPNCYNDDALGASALSGSAGGGGNDSVSGNAGQLAQLGQAISMAADKMCNPWHAECPCNQRWDGKKCVPGPNTNRCSVGVCKDTVNGYLTEGICVAPNVCRAITTAGQGVDANLSQLQKLIGLSALMTLMNQNKSGTQQSPTPISAGATGCAQYYAVSVPTTDPCAYYMPPSPSSLFGSSTLGFSNDLDAQLSELLGKPSTSSKILNTVRSVTAPGSARVVATSTVIPVGAPRINSELATGSLQSGTQGNIEVTNIGGTIYARSRDIQSGSEVSGFYGGSAFGGTQPRGVVANLCINRPWATSVVSYVIPPPFFDGLCSWAGYQVGPQLPAVSQGPRTVTFTQPAPKPTIVATSTPATPLIVKIWASPATVPIGARTLIFWNSQGATSCLIKSPDGSFNQNTLSGGASTVPVTSDTVFTISCVGSNGEVATDNVTVRIAI